MLLKKKQCGHIKGHGQVDGRKQLSYIGKEDTGSQTVSSNTLFLSCVIDETEERDMTTVTIPSSLMQVDIYGEVNIKLKGTMADIFTKLDPKLYSKHVRIEGGK